MTRIFELPEIPLSIASGLLFAALVAIGILTTRRFAKRLDRDGSGNSVVEMTLTVFSMFYGILLGLLVVGAYDNVNRIDDVVTEEAAAISTLHWNFDGFPEPVRTNLQATLEGYANEVVNHSFAEQSRGIRPAGEGRFVQDLYRAVNSFQPSANNEKALQGAAMSGLGELQKARQTRLSEFDIGIPSALWGVVLVGAAITLLLVCLLDFPLKRHLAFGCLLAFFIGGTIFVIASMDYPFSGTDHVTPQAIQDLLDAIRQDR